MHCACWKQVHTRIVKLSCWNIQQVYQVTKLHIWAKEVGIKSTYDHEAAQAIAAMNGGGVAVVGSAYNDQNGSGTYTYFNTVIKVDTSGNVSSCSQVASLVPSFTSYTLLESAQLLTSLNTVTQTNIGSSSSNVTVYTGNTCN
jgi:hypothetical protein